MKIYTKTGDDGETGLFGGPRVGKDDVQVEAFGTVDELNAGIGVTRAAGLPREMDALLARIQHQLFVIGAELATSNGTTPAAERIDQDDVRTLETQIDRYEATLTPLQQFILPGGTQAAALLHMARAVCRRAERRVVALTRTSQHGVSPPLIAYLNRLGDLLFVLARAANADAGQPDVPWKKAP